MYLWLNIYWSPQKVVIWIVVRVDVQYDIAACHLSLLVPNG